MLDRMRTALVESYVGAIVVGWLLADGLVRVTGIVTSPILNWVTQREFHTMATVPYSPVARPFPFQAALPDVIGAALLLLIGVGLLRWLYCEPATLDAANDARNEIS